MSFKRNADGTITCTCGKEMLGTCGAPQRDPDSGRPGWISTMWWTCDCGQMQPVEYRDRTEFEYWVTCIEAIHDDGGFHDHTPGQ